jgi:16S rRNA (guanine966-N2)-methyltransferase
MKIIAGKFKGRNIESSKDANYRPSTSRFRESVFNILNSGRFTDFNISEAKVLDLFCGTGSLGLESMSRGAKSVCFVDIDGENFYQIRNFAKKVQIENLVSYMTLDASKLCNAQMNFDLVFLDPPYKKDLISKTLESLLKYGWLKDKAYIVIECEKSDEFMTPNSYQIIDERKYGKTKLVILKYEQEQ